eukprot:9929180-Alexandrium_andersonii.AAC.1
MILAKLCDAARARAPGAGVALSCDCAVLQCCRLQARRSQLSSAEPLPSLPAAGGGVAASCIVVAA